MGERFCVYLKQVVYVRFDAYGNLHLFCMFYFKYGILSTTFHSLTPHLYLFCYVVHVCAHLMFTLA